MALSGVADVRLLPVLDTDPGQYNEVVSGDCTPEQVAGGDALEKCYAEIRESVEAFRDMTSGRGVVTVHTSPFFRRTFLQEPFLGLWKEAVKWGLDLALHPHEDRPGGGTYFGEESHLMDVIPSTTAVLRSAGLAVDAFRTGYGAYTNHVTPALETAGLTVDLSAVPGMYNPHRDVDWRRGPMMAQRIDREDYQASPPRHPSRVLTVPLGWDGQGAAYQGHYLFNEVNDVQALQRVWNAVRERHASSGQAQVVLFLCHTYGLCDSAWRKQAAAFLHEVGDALIGVGEVKNLLGAGS